MVNGLGVLGWGVGGIEAEAAMLGQPVSMLIPRVVGFELHGELPEGATATDLVLTITEMLRKHGVVGKFVEFFGDGVTAVPLANRATIGNMSPEFGSTCAIFPIDEETLRYLRFHGSPGRSGRARRGVREGAGAVARSVGRTGLLGDAAARPRQRGAVDRGTQATAGPGGPVRCQGVLPYGAARLRRRRWRRPQDVDGRGRRRDVPGERPGGRRLQPRPCRHHDEPPPDASGRSSDDRASNPATVLLEDGTETEVDHGSVVIAAITSCTNTSNPSVMVGAALLAKKAVERGLDRKPWVKTTLAPGSKVVMDYYDRAGLTPYLEKLGFHLVGYGCTTCIGNSGPLSEGVSAGVNDNDLAVVSVLSGNRNFEGRIQPDVKMNYLASPPLVVAYALAGSMDVDLTTEPLGQDSEGNDILLADIWPTPQEVQETIDSAVSSEMFTTDYADVFTGDERWRSLPVPESGAFAWDDDSTYVRKPPYFDDMPAAADPRRRHRRALACSPSWVTASRPTTFPRPGRSRQTRRPGATSPSTASSGVTSTRTALDAATTR